MKMYSSEWKADRLNQAVNLIREMEDDEIGFSTDEMWDSVVSFLLDLYCSHELARTLAIKAFRKCGYDVEE